MNLKSSKRPEFRRHIRKGVEMKMLQTAALIAGVILGAACTDGPWWPDLDDDDPPDAISVMTWNVYVGTNVDAIIAALIDGDPNNDVPTVLAQLDTLFLTDFQARADAIVDQIAERRPHAVGLQEITTFDLSAVGLGTLDFMAILEAALDERDLEYEIAGSVLNIDATVQGLRLQDFDVLLVDEERVEVLDARAKTFDLNLVDLIGPVGGIELRRGYVVATVEIDDIDDEVFTIVSTHPEPDLGGYDFSDLRAAQATEIATVLGNASPAIVMGDLNDDSGSLLYQVFSGSDFVDAWAALQPGMVGFTCCHEPGLWNDTAEGFFDQRIDYILVRGLEDPLDGTIEILGDEPADKMDGPAYRIWPSDHAGLSGKFFLPPEWDD